MPARTCLGQQLPDEYFRLPRLAGWLRPGSHQAAAVAPVAGISADTTPRRSLLRSTSAMSSASVRLVTTATGTARNSST